MITLLQSSNHAWEITYICQGCYVSASVCLLVCLYDSHNVCTAYSEFQQQCTVIKEKDLVLKAKANMTLVNTLDAVDMGSHSDHKYLCFNTGKGEVKVNTDLYSASL